EYQLIHIVESVSARYSNNSSDDAETRKDTERLNSYVSQLIQKGYKATAMLGYTHRVKEIVRLVNESNAEMLIMGAHRHSGIKDYVFGETIEDVRHQLTIPVLIVNVSEKAIPQ
ncbi:MAG: universal stress protein, partial [Sediminibacterium sp.]|nr:universal stress protein [Sediminibacterium sp.]